MIPIEANSLFLWPISCNTSEPPNNLPFKSTFPAVKDLLHTCAFDVFVNPISKVNTMINIEKFIFISCILFIDEFNYLHFKK